jgi:hypothetical protein
MEGGRSERGPHPWCKAGPWVRVRRWPKRVACTMRAHGAGGGGRCAQSVKSWFGRIESIHWRSGGTHTNSGPCTAWRTVCNEIFVAGWVVGSCCRWSGARFGRRGGDGAYLFLGVYWPCSPPCGGLREAGMRRCCGQSFERLQVQRCIGRMVNSRKHALVSRSLRMAECRRLCCFSSGPGPRL